MGLSRENDKNLDDRLTEVFDQGANDIFIKHNEDPNSSALVIKDSRVSLYTGEGKFGMVVNSGGDLVLQGRVILRVSGFEFIKGHEFCSVTENPLSFIPSTVATPIAGYLWKPPDILSFFSGFKKLLDDFLNVLP